MAVNGMGTAHFKWNPDGMQTLRKQLRWFEPLAVPLGFVVLFFDLLKKQAEWADSIGRACFVASMVILTIFLHRLLRPASPIWPRATTGNKGLMEKQRRLIAFLGFGLPASLGLLAIAGYFYTALQFQLRLRYSMGFALALVTINSLMLRWLFVTRRQLAVKQALEAKSRREQEAAHHGETETTLSPPPLDTEKLDIPAIDAQTRQLFKTSITLATMVGMFLIWSSVLPALRGLDRVQLLPTLAIVSPDSGIADDDPVLPQSTPAVDNSAATQGLAGGSMMPGGLEEDAANTQGTVTEEVGLPTKLTLADVLLALLFTLLTSIAAKNLPALLELSLLQRLPLDSGSRYAVSTIVRYLILLIGVSAVSGALSIGWQKIQWMAAALTFGLAFGLQEIFANFVSGLIILIERPIRVGDVVTVGETEGRVTQLRMRATTILDWDRREYLVPNKEFITGNIINWTLSDPVTRVIIPVGIAYGSDTEMARKLLLTAARENPYVLADPEASAVFRAFGASSLDFELRVFIANRDLWPRLVDTIHTQIDVAFRKAKIEIAFPQCDLHIRSAEGLRETRSVPPEAK